MDSLDVDDVNVDKPKTNISDNKLDLSKYNYAKIFFYSFFAKITIACIAFIIANFSASIATSTGIYAISWFTLLLLPTGVNLLIKKYSNKKSKFCIFLLVLFYFFMFLSTVCCFAILGFSSTPDDSIAAAAPVMLTLLDIGICSVVALIIVLISSVVKSKTRDKSKIKYYNI